MTEADDARAVNRAWAIVLVIVALLALAALFAGMFALEAAVS